MCEDFVGERDEVNFAIAASKFLAHAENALNVGDRVVIEESRPLSKRKRWAVREVIEKSS